MKTLDEFLLEAEKAETNSLEEGLGRRISNFIFGDPKKKGAKQLELRRKQREENEAQKVWASSNPNDVKHWERERRAKG